MSAGPPRLALPVMVDAPASTHVGAWDDDVPSDSIRFDQTMATMFGFPPSEGEHGVRSAQIVAALHPADRTLVHDIRRRLLEQGGLFVLEYRTIPSPEAVRWIMARGRYHTDARGKVIGGQGIVVDVTESRRRGYAEGAAHFIDTGDTVDNETPLERAARFAIEASHAIDALGAGKAPRLRGAIDRLLMELGHQLSRKG